MSHVSDLFSPGVNLVVTCFRASNINIVPGKKMYELKFDDPLKSAAKSSA